MEDEPGSEPAAKASAGAKHSIVVAASAATEGECLAMIIVSLLQAAAK